MALKPIAIARKGTLAYVGAIALTGDQIARAFEQLAERGGKVEHAARERFAQAEQATRDRFAKLARPFQSKARESLAEGQEQVGGALEKGRDRVLEALNLPTQDDVLMLKQELDRLAGVIDELRKPGRRPKTELVAAPSVEPPLPGYEKLNVEAVVDRLPGLDGAKLLGVRAYEQEHGKRVTVLRAIERALVERHAGGAPDVPPFQTTVEPLPRYNELPAEELVERLHGLDAAELLHVKVFEQEHAKRVTLLQAVEEHLAAKPAA